MVRGRGAGNCRRFMRGWVGQLTIANRNLANAQKLVDLLVTDGGFANVPHSPGKTDGAGVDMIINSTSLGLHADDRATGA